MARLRDVPTVFRTMGVFAFLRKVYFEINDDNLYTWAASLAYSWLFAIFPFFVFLLTLIPLLRPAWKQEAIKRINQAVATLPHATQITLHTYLDPKLHQLLYQPPPALTGILSLGLLITIWAASGGLNTTIAAMDKCYDVEKRRPFYKQRPLAIGLTLIVVTMILVVIVLIPIGTIVTRDLTSDAQGVFGAFGRDATHWLGPVWIAFWQVLRYTLAVLLMLWIVAIVYHFGPARKRKWKIITPGSIFTVAMWILLGLVFRVYVDKYGKYNQTYGAVGGVAVLLLLFYLDSLMLLIGAEINSEIDNAMAKFAKPAAPAGAIPDVSPSAGS